ncbi:Gfo/Idh/MocA family protein [Pseudalkalibacillus salsuginis]|uniref:Gfo/Idh/MocA family protein n=1 Tax=Pseudalkalibacillus salsuginis TaxID=2910972 RepID=UPI001F36BC0D|nr:Gfo/Idh/MocA family oxidoreductase [Pseudalkalibacillus salsuginis]MCF6408136.1 Gfo/Idh/MocA family oxidoreductase [Pseudalkalibacillus salsuginis]
MKRIKAGIIGTGFSAMSHLEALNRLPNVEVVAIASSKLAKAEKVADNYNINKAYGHVEDLIGDTDVEVVHNCSSNFLHFPFNKDVLQAGKHLLSEKPLAMNSKESSELVELADQNNCVAGVCFNYRHFPIVKQIREDLLYGQQGRVNLVYGGYVQDWCLYQSDYSWRMDPEKNGSSRAIADIGSHWCDTVQYILGKKIVEVFADLKTIHSTRKKPKAEVQTFGKSDGSDTEAVQIDTEDYGSVLVHFEDGIHGVFTVSQVSPGRKNKFYFDITTDHATYSWDQERPNRLWIGQRNEPNRELVKDPGLLSPEAATLAHYPGGHQEGWPDGLKNLMLDFYTSITQKDGDTSSYSFASLSEGHRIMQLIEAILKSHETKRWVRISE